MRILIILLLLSSACASRQSRRRTLEKMEEELQQEMRQAKSDAWRERARQSGDRYFVAKLWAGVLLCDTGYALVSRTELAPKLVALCSRLPGEHRRDAEPEEEGPRAVRHRRVLCGGVRGPSSPRDQAREEHLCKGRRGWVDMVTPY